MKDIKPEPFGRCAADRCPGRCPYRDPELMTPEGRSKLKDGPQPEPGQPWPVKVVHVLFQRTQAQYSSRCCHQTDRTAHLRLVS